MANYKSEIERFPVQFRLTKEAKDIVHRSVKDGISMSKMVEPYILDFEKNNNKQDEKD